MIKKVVICSILLFASIVSSAQDSLLINVYNRPHLDLNGKWNYIVDPYENGYYNYRSEAFDQQEKPSKNAYFMNAKPQNKSELLEYDFDKSDDLNVPGDWNTQKENLFYYEGTLWYKKSFDYSMKAGNRAFLYFEAVNYLAEVYLNGKKLGTHTGGFTPFNFDVTGLLKEKGNFIVVKVDNRRKREGVPTLNTDWWNYGGITRDVKLVEVPDNFIADYSIQLNPKDKHQLQGFVKLSGNTPAGKKITVQIPELGITRELFSNAAGSASINIKVPELKYWSPESPYRYTVNFISGNDKLSDKIGFRSIRTEGHNIMLNDKSIFLKGISIHEESPLARNRASSAVDARQLLTWAKELGCNYVRLAHYPHNEHMARIAEEIGILVWEEIPVYWTIDWENELTYKNAENQLSEVIRRDKNRASVVIWSIANETPTSDPRNSFLKRLAVKAKTLDPSRLISAALEQTNFQGDSLIKTITDPFADVSDVLSINEYIGWYDGLPEKTNRVSWKLTQDKPVIISEFGGDAKFGLHGDKMTRWSEEYQEYLYIETLRMLSKIEQLRGMSPWILKDFRSPRRPLPGIQDGWNRKGLISENGEKKKAFSVLKAYYDSKTPPK